MKILIAPWGYPQVYKEAEYRLNGQLFRSRTSTGALKRGFNPDYTILILQDSLAVYNPQTFGAENYRQMVESLQNFLIERYISNPSWIPDFDSKRDWILIAPNVGTFTNRTKIDPSELRIKGQMGDYYYWVLYNLSHFILEKARDADEVTIMLDTSHGLNIMPYLTYSALYNIAAVLDLKLHNKVKLQVFNSDPFLQGAEYLEIHLVRELYPKLQLALKLKTGRFLPVKVNKSFVGKETLPVISQKIQTVFGRYNLDEIYMNSFLPFIGAFFQGIIHGILHFFPPDTAKIESEICELYNSHIQLVPQGDENSILVARKLYFTEYFEILTYVRNLRKVMAQMGMERREEVSFSELKHWSERLYKNFPVVQSRIRYEIDSLKNDEKLVKHSTPNWVSFGKCGEEIHKRNFFAHAGLAQNAIEFKYDDGDYWIRFCKSSQNVILKYLKETITNQ